MAAPDRGRPPVRHSRSFGSAASGCRSTVYYEDLVVRMRAGRQFMSQINLKSGRARPDLRGRSVFDFRARQARSRCRQRADSRHRPMRSGPEALDEIAAHDGNCDRARSGRAALDARYARNFETAEQVPRALAQLELSACPTLLRGLPDGIDAWAGWRDAAAPLAAGPMP